MAQLWLSGDVRRRQDHARRRRRRPGRWSPANQHRGDHQPDQRHPGLAKSGVHGPSAPATQRHRSAGWQGAGHRRQQRGIKYQFKPGIRQLAGPGVRSGNVGPGGQYLDDAGQRGEISRLPLLRSAAARWPRAHRRRPDEPERPGQWLEHRDFLSAISVQRRSSVHYKRPVISVLWRWHIRADARRGGN